MFDFDVLLFFKNNFIATRGLLLVKKLQEQIKKNANHSTKK